MNESFSMYNQWIHLLWLLQLSTVVWNLLQAAKYPGRLFNETPGNWMHLILPLHVSRDECLFCTSKEREKKKKAKPQPVYFLCVCFVVGYFLPLCSACCLFCASFVQRLGLDLVPLVSCNNVDISQTKCSSDTGSYSWWFSGKQIVKRKPTLYTQHAHKCLFSPDYSLHCTSKGRGTVKYATNWGDVQRLVHRV